MHFVLLYNKNGLYVQVYKVLNTYSTKVLLPKS